MSEEENEEIDEEEVSEEEETQAVEKEVEEKKKYEEIPEDVEIVEERVYNVPLWKSFKRSRGLHRAKKASNFLREFIIRHMKNPNVKISPNVNKIIWSRGIKNPPRKISVKVVRTSEEEIWVLKNE